MGDFQRGGNRGGGFRGGNGGGRPSYGGNRGDNRGPVTMHKAVCDECHKSCEVPFRPSGDKPIYCNECFSSKKGGDDRGPRKDFGGDRGPRREFNDRPAPSFAKPTPTPMPAQDDVKKLLSEMNSKLDRLTSAIEKLALPKASVVSAPVAKAVVKKVEVKAKTVKLEAKKVVAKKPVSKKK